MKYPKLRELKEAVRSLFSRSFTTKYPFREHVPAERFRGLPEFHEDDCVGCGACANVCPARAIAIEDSGDKRTLTYRAEYCIFCGQCELNCLTGKGIILSGKFDIATTGSRNEVKQAIKKELVMCSSCGEAIAPYDQYRWTAEKLGPLLYSNTSLFNAYLDKNIGISAREKASSGETGEAGRAARAEVLCPACRRKAVYKS